ncbi:tail fiber assembly protein [Gilliamella sp. B2865]|uniref:tail fiber assembly protein n=1 Tax=Gilliamella sp. B2865 TaxID=2817984 RepID=UPI0022699551|nr:tail fiber assembly protein [Gilliamella sp. B2865]MCX8678619.1 tail fiber assembly protein [Gilliamella sp. B2865]
MIYYNATTNGFYNSEINIIPKNSVEITHEYHAELLQKQSAGFVIQTDKNGYPIAVERTLTAEEIKTLNESQQQRLISAANEKITLLQRAIKYNVATDNEKQLLEQLELFTINVSRIDTSNINVVFPEMPE